MQQNVSKSRTLRTVIKINDTVVYNLANTKSIEMMTFKSRKDVAFNCYCVFKENLASMVTETLGKKLATGVKKIWTFSNHIIV